MIRGSRRSRSWSGVGRLVRPALLCLAGALSAATGCGSGAAESRPFPGSAASLRELGEGVLQGLSAGDTALLRRFRLTEREHNEVVWPELPASNPGADFPVDWAWTNVERRDRRALARLDFLRGHDLALRAVECRGRVREFRTFRVHTDCWVTFEAEGTGLVEARLFKDVLERNGGLKIFRYYEEPVRRLAASAGGPEDALADGDGS